MIEDAPNPKRRTRLNPDARRSQLLDHTAALVREAGVSAVNMERLARRAGVSKPLVYIYFPSRTELLRALLQRELDRNLAENAAAVAGTTTMPEMVRATSRLMLGKAVEHGEVMQRLLSEPEIADDVLALRQRHAGRYTHYLAARLKAEYGIPSPVSDSAVEIALGMSSAASARVARGEADPRFVEDILVSMILGALQAVGSDHEGYSPPDGLEAPLT